MTKKTIIGIVLFLLISAALGGLFGQIRRSVADDSLTPASVTADYREALDVIDQNYAGKVNHEDLTQRSIQSMLWTLDPHSSYFTAEDFRKLFEEQSSRFFGIGVSILQHRDGVYVQSVFPGTPADKIGLRYGDRFVEVDGKDATKWTSSEVSKNVRGIEGTSVVVKVERVESSKPIEFTIVRGGVPLPSIRNYFMLRDGVGYVGLSGGFQETTAEELDDAIRELSKQGMTSLILDLRNNPGGLLPQAIKVVSRFVSEDKTVVSVKGRSRYANSQELVSEGGNVHSFPLVVMINGGSASASEIVAGAVQDYNRGVIVGTGSFGKGLVQRIFQLPFGTGLTLTTARYYTPLGRSLQRDYSNGSIYDYYTHNGEGDDEDSGAPKPIGSPVTAPDGRTLYGGRGIEPDIKAAPAKFSPLRGRISEAAFYFSRQLVAGAVKGFEDYRRGKQTFVPTIANNDLVISDRLYEAFRAFAASDKENGLTAENVDSQADFAKTRLRAELATASYSTEAGSQVLTEADQQVLKAVEAMDRARKLIS